MFEYFAGVIAGLLGFDGFPRFSMFYCFWGNYRGFDPSDGFHCFDEYVDFYTLSFPPLIVNELVALLVVLFFVIALKCLLV